MKIRQKILLLFASLFFGQLGFTQTDTSAFLKTDTLLLLKDTISVQDTTFSIFNLFDQNEITEITIETDLKKLKKSKRKNYPKYQGANLSFTDNKQKKWALELAVRPRGRMRKRYCSFPPVKLRFSPEILQEAGLDATFNTLKLVSHCKKHRASTELLMREYLIYQMYNLLTERSYRVKLLQVNYVDSPGNLKPETHFAFFLENTKEMASRNGGAELEPTSLQLALLQNETTALMDIFQFMIGNTDYKIIELKNIKLLQIKNKPGIFPIPYDFDFSGLVDATYARPREGVNIENVKQRMFTGFCQPESNWVKALQKFKDQREAIFTLIEENEHLGTQDKKSMTHYLQSFYQIIEDPSSLEKQIKNRCEK